MKQINMLESPVRQVFFSYLVPSISATLVTSIYILADMMMIGRGVGGSGIAAMNILLPLYNTYFGIGMMCGVGGSVLFGFSRGRGDEKRARSYFTAALCVVLALSAVFLILGRIFFNPLITFMGNTPLLNEYTVPYGTVLTTAAPMFALSSFLQAFVRNDGAPKLAMAGVISGGVTNVILDYVCILAFSMGVGGAAVATVISQVVSVVLCVIHIKKHFPILQVERRHFKLKKTEVRTMLSGGLSMGMMSSLVNLGTLILQTGINTLGTSVIVAHTAARKVFEIWGLPVTVLGSTMATYSGQNYGAGKYDRITSGLKAALLLGCGWAVMVVIMAYTIATYLVGFIASTDSAEILYWGTTYLRVDMLFEMVCVWIVILRNTMQGV